MEWAGPGPGFKSQCLGGKVVWSGAGAPSLPGRLSGRELEAQSSAGDQALSHSGVANSNTPRKGC